MSEKNSETIENIVTEDVICCSGIMSRGYGQLPKAVMLDPDLTIEAKAIYAYFASFTGGGSHSAFPCRNKILNDLHMTKDAYYRHFNQLVNKGYITVKQQNESRFSRNIYTIVLFPEKYNQDESNASEARRNALYLIRSAHDIFAAGYGNVPKSVMTDNTISIQAKGVYAYFCVWAGQDMNATPNRDTILFHLGITHSTYNKHMNQLIEHNYITRSRVSVSGKFAGYVFHINASVEKAGSSPEAKKRDAEKRDAKKRDAKKPDAKKPDAKKLDTNNTSITIPKKNKNSIKHTKPNQSDPVASNVDAWSDGGNTDDDILYEISERNCITPEILSNTEKITTAVNLITGTECMFKGSGDMNTADLNDLLSFFKDSLKEMLTARTGTTVSGVRITASQVNSVLTTILDAGHSSDGPYATLGNLPSTVIEEYLQCATKTQIKKHKAYMKSIIWTTMNEWKVAGISAMAYDFGPNGNMN